MGLGLGSDGSRILRVLAHAPESSLSRPQLTRRTGWPDGRIDRALERLAAGLWVVVDPPQVALTDWAVAYLTVERPQIHLELIADPDNWPDRRYPDGEPHVVCAARLYEWRELHARGCGCHECQAEVSATQPPPRGACGVCGGRGPGVGWTCLACGRRGDEEQMPPLPHVLGRGVMQAAKGGLKGGLG